MQHQSFQGIYHHLSQFVLLSFLLVGTFLAATELPDRQYPFFRVTDESGLPNNEVITIMQDHHGYIWFGTTKGLARFDGYSFKTYFHDPNSDNTLSDDKIWCLFEDQAGNIWIGTELGGLNRLDPTNGKITHYQHDPLNSSSLSHNYVRKIISADKDKLWIATSGGGLNLFDPQINSFTRFQHKPNDSTSIAEDYLRALLPDAVGGLWIGTRDSGLDYLNPDRREFKHYRKSILPRGNGFAGPSSNLIQSLLWATPNELLIGTWNGGLNKLSLDDQVFTHFPISTINNNGTNDRAVISMLKSKDDIAWLGTINGGLNHFTIKTEKFKYYKNDPLNDKTISAGGIFNALVDRNGLIWTTHWGAGASFMNPSSDQFTAFTYQYLQNINFPSGSIGGVAVDNDGTLWLGSEDGGLSYFDFSQKNFISLKSAPGKANHLSNNDVDVIYPDPVDHDILWIGTRFGGLNRLNRITKEFEYFNRLANNENSLSGNHVRAVIRDKKDHLWVATTRGLTRIHLPTMTFTRYQHDKNKPNSLSHNSVYTLLEDSFGHIWAGTNGGGLNLFTPETESFIHFQHDRNIPNSLNHNSVWSIQEDSKRRLWITTSRGLNQIDLPKLSTSRNKLKSFGFEKYPSMLIDENDQLWLSSQRGIVNFNPTTELFHLYNSIDGALTHHNYPAAYKDKNNTMYFGGEDGLTYFTPTKMKMHRQPKQVTFTNLTLYSKMASANQNSSELSNTNAPINIENAKSIFIPFNEPVFTLEFSPMDYNYIKHARYQYFLEGFDTKWNESTLNQLTYTNLDPGKYTLRIKLFDGNYQWMSNATQIDIEIETPPWLTIWAFTFYGLLFLIILKFYFNVQRKKIEYAALKEISHSDQLTGLRNRFFINQYIEDDISLCLREYRNRSVHEKDSRESDLIFFIIDIDHFKKVNDDFGHHAGDHILKQMKTLLETIFRDSDYLVRWGGEEFLVVARFTDRRNAAQIAERLRVTVEQYPFNIAQSQPVYKTVSIGYVAFPLIKHSPSAFSWSKTLELADHCLYAAKMTSRNAWIGMDECTSKETESLFSELRNNTQSMIDTNQVDISMSTGHLKQSKGDIEILWRK